MIGYARVSTSGQTLAAQIGQLEAAGCTAIFQETAPGSRRNRAQLEKERGPRPGRRSHSRRSRRCGLVLEPISSACRRAWRRRREWIPGQARDDGEDISSHLRGSRGSPRGAAFAPAAVVPGLSRNPFPPRVEGLGAGGGNGSRDRPGMTVEDMSPKPSPA
ncbi:recombinase family protein [Hansschlegelia sp. KR7-227]|uniref:recombinase family protein n=1 Tax=Hansschlegelia sp. KR7-227 TaxID=3400914 RepID=UPI003C115FF0